MRTTWFKSVCYGLLIKLLFSLACYSQADRPTNEDWKGILNQHKTGTIHDTVYLLKAQALTELSFKDPTLKNKLAKYQEIAWSKRVYHPYRVKYYAFLANHTTFTYQEGLAIYYLQKMEEELQKVKPYMNSLNQPRLLLSIYGTNDYSNQDKRIAIIDSVMPYLRSLPVLLSKQSVNINTCVNAFTILKQSALLYAIRRDTAKILQVEILANNILKEIKKKPLVDKAKIVHCELLLYLINAEVADLLSRNVEEGRVLNAAYQSVINNANVGNAAFKRAFENTILTRLIDYHIAGKHNDSANYFFELYKNKVLLSKSEPTMDSKKFLFYSGKINALNRQYKSGYEDLLRASHINDSIIAVRTADIQNNMYAHVLAEHRYKALAASQEQSGRRNVAIFVILVLLITTVAGFMRVIRINKEKAGVQIRNLNEATQIQIAKLEAQANVIQKKLGLELHDDIAGRLASIVNYIETKMLDETDPESKNKLAVIANMARSAYTSTRTKSHELYFQSLEEEKTAFSERVTHIVGMALPNDKYDKEIEIDNQCLEELPPEMRINLLRIIQEAVANILKHAKASKVKLFIYEEDGLAVLQINDNGRGFDKKMRSNGLGLQSLKTRVMEMNGSLNIASSGNGTELVFNIPLRGRSG